MRFFYGWLVILSLSLALPVYAQNQFYRLVNTLIDFIINPLIWLLLILATLIFLWGTVQFIISTGSGNEDGINAGKKHIVWGLVGLFIMLSSWGFIRIIGDFFR